MSGYLQRLLDRGAGLAAAPSPPTGAEAAPAMASGSPVLSFDQRLGEGGLASDFGILGVSPDPEALGDEGATEIPAPVTPVRPAVPLGTTSTESAVPAFPANPVQPLPSQADRSIALPSSEAALATTPADVTVSERPIRALQPEARRDLSPQPVALAPSAPRLATPAATPSALTSAQAVPRTRAPEAMTPEARPPVRNRATPAAPQPTPLPPITTPAIPAIPAIEPLVPIAREVEPPRPAPPPLAPPASSIPDAPAIERVVREAVRAELARQPAPQAPSPRSAPANEDQAPAKPAPRPATAREASVIGALEPSASPLTIYGVRRR
ncbi:hypothetical protein AB2M62_01410 [Sphingomonas sp. MMS12-HWE2-04]|uniref:hypothetical protein n=1 Tax=Sphingomonas sp. MMS12-HWE2-04 TaxID=3234199 RepID=UPI0038501765